MINYRTIAIAQGQRVRLTADSGERSGPRSAVRGSKWSILHSLLRLNAQSGKSTGTLGHGFRCGRGHSAIPQAGPRLGRAGALAGEFCSRASLSSIQEASSRAVIAPNDSTIVDAVDGDRRG